MDLDPLLDVEVGTEARRTNAAEFTVSELARAVKRTVEDGFGRVRVRGEISGFRGRHSSGHAYFGLKDEAACVDAVVWRGSFANLGIEPEEGLEVIAAGRMTTFPRSSKYQIVIDRLEPAGLGALMKLLEERRKKLAAEGLFDEARKRPLPVLPRVIGVVTSPTGAVIRDILHRVTERFPSHVVVWPVRVQGETCGAEIAAAVTGFASDYGGPRPDVIIVARGGGSVEDLWGYNDEALVRAVAASPIPVVSAVGHETDWTLIDHAADKRAPTPTGAAEIVLPVRVDLTVRVDDRRHRLDAAMASALVRRGDTLRMVARVLPSAEGVLSPIRQRLDIAADKLPGAMHRATADARARFSRAAVLLTPRTARRPLDLGAGRLGQSYRRLEAAAVRGVSTARREAARAAVRLRPQLVTRPLANGRASLDRLSARQRRAAEILRGEKAGRLAGLAKLLEAVSYTGVLERGFALVRRDDDTPVRRAGDVARGERLTIEFADDRVSVTEASRARQTARSSVRSVKRTKSASDAQGVLF